MSYRIVDISGEWTDRQTGARAIMAEISADTASDLPSNTADLQYVLGSWSRTVDTGDIYRINSSGVWVLQPSTNVWQNIYTKAEIDEMITEINGIIAYYHTVIVSDTGEITFYALAGYIGTWTIYGNGSQTGTPTPDNPVMPTFCGVRTGNLFDRTGEISPYFINESGEILPISSGIWYVSDFMQVQPNTTYTFTYNSLPGTAGYHAFYDANKELISTLSMSTYTFTTPNNARYMRFSYRGESYDIMLNSGSTALPYEPYGWKIPLTCAGQTTPVYLGQVSTVRRVKKQILTGTENVAFNSRNDTYGQFVVTIPAVAAGTNVETNVISTHIKTQMPTNARSGIAMRANAVDFVVGMSYDDTGITAPTDASTIVSACKAYLAQQYANGTPVTVWYVLDNEQTGIVNEPLAKIGDYCDELSSTDAAVTIPTVKGENTLTVDTTLKPSKIEISGESN